MSRTKKSRYEESLEEKLLIQSGKEFFKNCKGKRNSDYFENSHPIVLELACGRGEYTIGLSQHSPEKNFVGVDIKGERMMIGIAKYKRQEKEKLPITSQPNIAFLRTIIHHIDQFFDEGEVDEIWIVHPDPRSKGHDERRRLTSSRFLTMYSKILKQGGLLKLKTDDDGLFDYSLGQLETFSSKSTGNITKNDKKILTDFKVLDVSRDLHRSNLLSDHYGIVTHYEQEALDLGKTIKYFVSIKQ